MISSSYYPSRLTLEIRIGNIGGDKALYGGDPVFNGNRPRFASGVLINKWK
jgi:hypothetical protein